VRSRVEGECRQDAVAAVVADRDAFGVHRGGLATMPWGDPADFGEAHRAGEVDGGPGAAAPKPRYLIANSAYRFAASAVVEEPGRTRRSPAPCVPAGSVRYRGRKSSSRARRVPADERRAADDEDVKPAADRRWSVQAFPSGGRRSFESVGFEHEVRRVEGGPNNGGAAAEVLRDEMPSGSTTKLLAATLARSRRGTVSAASGSTVDMVPGPT
jgi:hypothetical protein